MLLLSRAGNFDTTHEPDRKLAGLGLCLMSLGHKRVDPFTTRLSCLNGPCHRSPPPDPFILLKWVVSQVTPARLCLCFLFFVFCLFFFSPNQSYHLYG
jgi:hypothetical protein